LNLNGFVPFVEAGSAKYKKLYPGCPAKPGTILEKYCHESNNRMQIACQPDSLSAFSAYSFTRRKGGFMTGPPSAFVLTLSTPS